MYKKHLVFISACVGMLIFGIVMISLGTINTFLSAKFNLDEISVASLAALLPFGILTGSLVFGPIADRYSYKSLLVVCSLFILVGLELISFTSTFAIIQIAFFMIGFGGGAINGGTNALVADISEGEKGSRLSLLGVFFGVGALGFPLIMRMLSETFSYESIVAGIGLFVIIPISLFLTIKFPLPKHPQGFPIKYAFSLIKESSLLLLSFILFFQSGLEGITNNWSTRYFENFVGMSTGDSLTALTVLALSLTLTRLLFGAVLKKVPAYVILYICAGFVFAGSILMLNASDTLSIILAMIFLGIGYAAPFPVVLGYIGELYSSLSGTAFSIALFIALIGNTLINYLVGVISQSEGIQIYPYIIIVTAIFFTITLIISLKTISKKIKI